jgi:hypothetical protein
MVSRIYLVVERARFRVVELSVKALAFQPFHEEYLAHLLFAPISSIEGLHAERNYKAIARASAPRWDAIRWPAYDEHPLAVRTTREIDAELAYDEDAFTNELVTGGMLFENNAAALEYCAQSRATTDE